MKSSNSRVSPFGTASLVVMAVFFINILAIPAFTTKGVAAEGAGAAGAAAGGGTAAGITTGTIAAGVAVAAAAALAIATSGGSDMAVATAPSAASAAGTALATTNPAAASTVANALSSLNTTALSTLATANTALGTAGQTSLATAASTMNAAQFTNYLATGGGGAYTVGSAQYNALQSLYSSYTPTQLAALQAIYAAGATNTATMSAISSVITNAGAGTPEQQAENLRQAILAMLTARHPGANVIVTTVHHGNSVYSTVSHVSAP